jgi:hypothetical protein
MAMTYLTLLEKAKSNDELMYSISPIRDSRTIRYWANLKYGAIVDVKGNGELRFVEYKYKPIPEDAKYGVTYRGDCSPKHADNDVFKSYQGEDAEEHCPVVASGFVAYLLKCLKADYNPFLDEWFESVGGDARLKWFESKKGAQQMYNEYFDLCKKDYVLKHKRDPDAPKHNYEKEYATGYHLEEEKKKIDSSKAIFEYLNDVDVNHIKEYAENYWDYIKEKIREEYGTELKGGTSDFPEARNPDIFDKRIKIDQVLLILRDTNSDNVKGLRKWFVIWMVFKQLEWLTNQHASDFVLWITNNFGWSWEATNFASIQKEFKTTLPSKWGQDTIKGNPNLGKLYFDFAVTVRDLFVDVDADGNIKDRENFADLHYPIKRTKKWI